MHDPRLTPARPDLAGDKLPEQLVWTGSHNAYNRFKDMLEQMMPAASAEMPGMMRPACGAWPWGLRKRPGASMSNAHRRAPSVSARDRQAAGRDM